MKAVYATEEGDGESSTGADAVFQDESFFEDEGEGSGDMQKIDGYLCLLGVAEAACAKE